MTIDKAITEKDLIKAKMLADFIRRYEDAKEKGFKGSKEDFIRRIKKLGLSSGGPVKPNGTTTLTTDQWLNIVDPGGWASEEDKPMKKAEVKPKPTFPQSAQEFIDMSNFLQQIKPVKPKKVVFKYGATSQSEEDLIGSHVDDWTNLINKGELDPSVSFMKYLDMILGRSGANRGGIVSVI